MLIVEGEDVGDERLHSGYFLQKALAAGGSDITSTKAIPVSALDDTALENYSAVFLAEHPGIGRPWQLVRLDGFLQGGGTVVLFLRGDLATIKDLSRIDFLPAKPLGISELSRRLASRRISRDPTIRFLRTHGTPTPLSRLCRNAGSLTGNSTPARKRSSLLPTTRRSSFLPITVPVARSS